MSFGAATLTGLGVALGCGLLIGIERERRKGSGPTPALAGVRTFTLASLAGAMAQALGQPLLVGVGALLILLLATIAYLHERRAPDRNVDPGVTTELALFVTFLLGVAAIEHPALAAGAAAVVAALLSARARLHRFSTDVLSTEELRDALLLAGAALVVLPLVPSRRTAGQFTVGRRRRCVSIASTSRRRARNAAGSSGRASARPSRIRRTRTAVSYRARTPSRRFPGRAGKRSASGPSPRPSGPWQGAQFSTKSRAPFGATPVASAPPTPTTQTQNIAPTRNRAIIRQALHVPPSDRTRGRRAGHERRDPSQVREKLPRCFLKVHRPRRSTMGSSAHPMDDGLAWRLDHPGSCSYAISCNMTW
jgi:hypothetical protein